MRSLRLSVAALLAMGAAGGFAATAASASASSVTPVIFTGLTVTPNPISYGNSTVTVSGQLDEAVQQSDGTWAPGATLPDESVLIEYAAPGASLANPETLDTVTTDASGDFTATESLPAGGTIQVETGQNTGYGYNRASASIQTDPAPTAATLDAQPTSRVWAGTNLTFTGKATVQVNGVAQPLADAPVELYVDGGETMGSATTGADGTFTVPVKAASVGGQWTAVVTPPSGALYGQSTSNADTVNMQYNTRVVNVAYPATAEAHTPQKLTGTVQEYNGTSWVPADGLMVGVYYRTSSTGAWKSLGDAQGNPDGTFSTVTQMAPGEKQVQVRALQWADGDVYLASSGPVKTIKVYDHTIFQSANQFVSHFNGRTLLGADIVDWWGSGNTDHSWATVTGTAKVYYRPNTSAAWKYLGSAKLGQGGSFDYTYYGTLHGYFYIQYPAQGYFLASKSATLHIS
jgi:hypothetical protein